ncbi:hypothetical protein R6Q59_028634 [Mikania micrantha]
MNPVIWHKVAAVSGMAALGLGTYGAHAFKPTNPSYKEVNLQNPLQFLSSFSLIVKSQVWNTASLYHLVHTAALLGAPIAKNPNIVTSSFYFINHNPFIQLNLYFQQPAAAHPKQMLTASSYVMCPTVSKILNLYAQMLFYFFL